MNLNERKQGQKKEEGFTLVEVIAVLVILGILAAVAVPKFFDMQDTARRKAIEGAVGELNGQVALAFAQWALTGNVGEGYSAFTGYIGPDFVVEMPSGTPTAAGTNIAPATGTIEITGQAASQLALTWNAGSAESPGYFSLP